MIPRLLKPLLVLSLFALQAWGQDKSLFDIMDSPLRPSSSLAKTGGFGVPGWILTRGFGECSLMQGGYFTFGTDSASDPKGLDGHCAILFGHPLAKTSFPLVYIDGSWQKPEAVFDPDSCEVVEGGDSIAMRYRKEGALQFTFTLFLEENGRTLRVSSHIKNLDTVQHIFGLAFDADPALGKNGDGMLVVAGRRIGNDTVITEHNALTGVIEVRERDGLYPGMRIGLEFPGGSPSSLIASNWVDAIADPAPTYTPSPIRSLYDLVLEMVWEPATLQPLGDTSATFLLRQLTPDFGPNVFLRWDLPDHATLNHGVLYPAELPTMITASTAGAGHSVTMEIGGGQGILGGTGTTMATLGAGSTAFIPRTMTLNEIYQPAVLSLPLACREGELLLDSLVRRMYVPATPVSDTGLTVTIDSLILSNLPNVQAIFTTRRNSTGGIVTGLTDRNVWVYDNGARMTNAVVSRDTTGARKVDVVFVLDVTGSMTDEIDGVKNNIEEFADSMLANVQAFRLGMVTFLDNIENVYDFTSDVAVFKANVAAQYAHGGDDWPENSLDALYQASEMSFAEGANRMIIWITDAPYHETDSFTSRTRQEVINRLLLSDITVYCIGAPTEQTDWYNPIVNATGGSYYDIYGNFRDIMLDITRHQSSGRYVASYQAPMGTSHTLTVWVHYGGLGGSDTNSFSTSSATATHAGLQVYPNPFNPTTVVSGQWTADSEIRIVVFDLLGREVATLANGLYPAGRHSFIFDANRLASGTYFVRLEVRSPQGKVLARDLSKILHIK